MKKKLRIILNECDNYYLKKVKHFLKQSFCYFLNIFKILFYFIFFFFQYKKVRALVIRKSVHLRAKRNGVLPSVSFSGKNNWKSILFRNTKIIRLKMSNN